MDTLPSLADFRATYMADKPQVVWTHLVGDLETPVSAFMKLADGRSHCFLLDSVEGGAVRGRYSFIGLKPDLIWRCHRHSAEINRDARHDTAAFDPDPRPPLDSLRAVVAESRIDLPPELPPQVAGLFGYMGYDTVRLVETVPDENPDTINVPDGVFLRPTVMVVFDNIQHRLTLATPVWPRPGVDARSAHALARERLADTAADLERALPLRRLPGEPDPEPEATPMMAAEHYKSLVRRAKEYILAGDIFQVVLSQRFTLPFRLPPFSLYRALRRTNPSPYMVYLDLDGYQIVGASPEILVRLRDGEVTIRPIAGTRKRGKTAAEDAANAADLLADPKECAEHLMLLDLGRNDVGRVAEVGTVRVTDRFFVEYYSHVMHIVSNVVGTLRGGQDAMDALMAGFPAGTVSGAPKVRAMEIIEELESVRRGFYAGAVGYISANGNMDTCIALRTALVKDGVVHIQAGGGIVADSDPEMERQECWNKAQALIAAAKQAVRFAGR
ncbi:anthranilate synthase component I [Roseospira visakhapatnamensis]|uniref:Anthranilate synthase component 1 n=1 Tax=Roseospira visakhapatnamensis TaxID=390880 RepID=A0A7W6RHF6_9PROT|nr:anthranilate synthase component I [Roseospira visakhapatnamensis]MBB4268051.1 anthranilate synthase component 1 [Roseospira visakhapatnamensis]